ncbi:TetR/AcrR family transcriptional regulator [Nocardia higoensis]|uniref:TetR/AcrR family transcriptional regulator n=1 Tax=Nocardia higoensis TaxID=228599 RepID=UPI000316F47E|nr:TetR/AcrR family transcriptional regulator [Nocardia higoensis]
MTTSAPRSYGGVSAEDRRADRRARLLAAARTTWGRTGMAAVTVRGVCKTAGLTDRYFYEHFANRDELLVAVADDVRDHLLAVLVRAGVSAEGGVEDKLRAALEAFLDTLAGDPHLHRIVSSDPGDVPALAQRRHDVLAIIADLVVANAPDVLESDWDHDALRRAAMYMTGGVDQLVEGWLAGTIEMTAPELADECARLCVNVMRATGVRPT